MAAKDTQEAAGHASKVASKNAEYAQAKGTAAKESAKKQAGSYYDSAADTASAG